MLRKQVKSVSWFDARTATESQAGGKEGAHAERKIKRYTHARKYHELTLLSSLFTWLWKAVVVAADQMDTQIEKGEAGKVREMPLIAFAADARNYYLM